MYRDSGLSDEQFREWLVYAADVAARATCRDEWMYFVGVLANSVGERAAETPPPRSPCGRTERWRSAAVPGEQLLLSLRLAGAVRCRLGHQRSRTVEPAAHDRNTTEGVWFGELNAGVVRPGFQRGDSRQRSSDSERIKAC